MNTYLLALSAGYILAYFVLFLLFPLFFTGRTAPLRWRSASSIAVIVASSFLAYAISDAIGSPVLGNRALHFLGGGVLAFVACFLVVRDTGTAPSKLQFFVFGFFVVTAMGVANELIELTVEALVPALFSFSPNPKDTWMDLLSNTVGAFLAGMILTSLVRSRKS